MKNRGMARRPLALTAAATIALGGLFFGSPAYAEDAAEQPVEQTTEPTAEATATPTAEATEQPTAPAAEEPVEDAPPAEVVEAAEAAEEEGVTIVAFGVNAAGEDVVVVTAESTDVAEGDAAIEAFTDSAKIDDANVVTVPTAPVAFAEGEVVGGQGYIGILGEMAYACSIGFSAFAPDGSPALLSAGHCAYDQNNVKLSDTTLTIPNQEPAVGGPGYEVPALPILLGEFGFAQFGSTDNAPGSNGDAAATDISVIDINDLAGYSLVPEVTNWTTAGTSLGSLADGTIPVKSVGSPVAGSISKSGRTTGFTSGTIDGNDLLDGWAQIEDRWVRGFSSNTVAAPGDSGGAVIQGTTAIGVISGGTEAAPGVEQWTWATSLVNALPKINGYEVALDLDAPAVTSPASGSTVVTGTTINGTAPGAESVEVAGVG
ncbi:MAG TPA: S1 family peptidase, partial [Microbacterium sp.]|nr:S1 family peptidase [Microbacterium sp.]